MLLYHLFQDMKSEVKYLITIYFYSWPPSTWIILFTTLIHVQTFRQISQLRAQPIHNRMSMAWVSKQQPVISKIEQTTWDWSAPKHDGWEHDRVYRRLLRARDPACPVEVYRQLCRARDQVDKHVIYDLVMELCWPLPCSPPSPTWWPPPPADTWHTWGDREREAWAWLVFYTLKFQSSLGPT